MKKFFIGVCFIAAFFDCITAFLGLCVANKVKASPGYAFCFVGALVVIALMASARDIWRKTDILHRCLRPFWLLAFMVNIAAVLLACFNHIILEQPLWQASQIDWQLVRNGDRIQLISVLVLTVFLTGAPIAVSHLWNSFFEDEEDDDDIPASAKGRKMPA